MGEPEWTATPPTEPGWWWAKIYADCIAEAVNVHRRGNDLFVKHPGVWDDYIRPSDYARWWPVPLVPPGDWPDGFATEAEATYWRERAVRLQAERDAVIRMCYHGGSVNQPGFWQAGTTWGLADTETSAVAAVRSAAGLGPDPDAGGGKIPE